MTRVYVIVEGQTEESFVSNVLAPALWPHRLLLIPIILGVPGHKGGRTDYVRLKNDVLKLLKQDRTAYCSTMLDFFRLGTGYPGTPLPAGLPALGKVTSIELAIKADIVAAVPDLRADFRLLPYIQLHEYEALLFSDPEAFARGIHQEHLAASFRKVRDEACTPEDIDDGPDTAPSKRVRAIYPPYRKVLDGTSAAAEVGLVSIRRECPHFRDWFDRLGRLAATRSR